MKFTLISLFIVLSIYNYAQPRFLDPSFGNKGKVITDFGSTEVINSIAFQSNGKIVAAGFYDLIKVISFDEIACALARYKTNGELDSSFGKNGFTYFKPVFASFKSIIVQNDDKIVGTGYAYPVDQGPAQTIILRCKKNGLFDSSFGNNGIIYFGDLKTNFIGTSLAEQSDGKFVVAGANNTINSWDSSFVFAARFNNNGTLDSSFGNNGSKRITVGFRSFATGVVINSKGEIIISGYNTPKTNTSFSRSFLIGLTSSGEMNKKFGNNGVIISNLGNNASFATMTLTKDEKIIAGGYVQASDKFEDYNFLLIKYKNNGVVDSSFGINGIVNSDLDYSDQITSLTIETDEKIIAAGTSVNVDIDKAYFALSRYYSDGKVDHDFGSQGRIFTSFSGYNTLSKILLQPDGKIIAGGTSSAIRHGYGDFALSRYLNDDSTNNKPQIPIAQKPNTENSNVVSFITSAR